MKKFFAAFVVVYLLMGAFFSPGFADDQPFNVRVGSINFYHERFCGAEQKGYDPSLAYPIIVNQLRRFLETHNVDIVFFPEETFTPPFCKEEQTGDQTHTWIVFPGVEVDCPQNNLCEVRPSQELAIYRYVNDQGKLVSERRESDHPISQLLVDTIHQFQGLAKEFGVTILVSTLYERLKVPQDLSAVVPEEYMKFNSVLFIDKEGHLTGVRRKTAFNFSYGCWSLLGPEEIGWQIVADPAQANHPFVKCDKAVRKFAYDTVKAEYFMTKEGGKVSYFPVICADTDDQQLLDLAVQKGIQDVNLMILPEAAGGTNVPYSPLMTSIQGNLWRKDTPGWPDFKRKLVDKFVGQYGIIQKGGFVVASDSLTHQSGAIQLHHLPQPLSEYQLTDGYLYAEVPIAPYYFIRGDSNGDGVVNLADVVHILRFLFISGDCWDIDATDVNDDGHANITDAIYLLNYLFQGGEMPLFPYPSPGEDLTRDTLICP